MAREIQNYLVPILVGKLLMEQRKLYIYNCQDYPADLSHITHFQPY